MDSSLLNLSSNVSLHVDCDKQLIFSKLWIVLSAISTILGLPATLIVLKELHKRSHQRDSNELFMINLTISDMAFLILNPISVINYMDWGFVAFECIDVYMDAFTLCSRPLFMACICVDCYFAVVHPITYRTTKKSNIIRKLTSLMVWISTVCFTLYNCIKMCLSSYSFYPVPLLVALPIIAFCDGSMLHALRKPNPTGKNNIHPLKSRALHTIFNSLAVTLIAYLPPVVIFSFVDVIPMKREDYNCKVLVFGFFFSVTGTFIMPLLYLNSVGKLDNLKNLLKKYIWN